MPLFITRVVATKAVGDRAEPRVMTVHNAPFATHAEAAAAARERFGGHECYVVEAKDPHEALQRVLPALDSLRAAANC